MSRYHSDARRFIQNNFITGKEIQQIAEHGLDSDLANYLIWESKTPVDKYHGLTPEQVQEHCQWLEMVESIEVFWDSCPRDPGWVVRYYHWPTQKISVVPLDAHDYRDALSEAAHYLAHDADPAWVERGLTLKLSM